MPDVDVILGDVLAELARIGEALVQCIVTSPPYWGLRAYAGVEPAVWLGATGRADCPHEWGENLPKPGSEYREGLSTSTFAGRGDKAEIRKQRHSVRSGLAAAASRCDGSPRSQSNRSDNEIFDDLPQVAGGTFCRLCGAWKGLLGQEPLHDCLAWARGEEPCSGCFVCHMRSVAKALWRVLRDDGVWFLNIGDSYAANGGWAANDGMDGMARGESGRAANPPRKRLVGGLKPKDLCLIPQRLALALQADGWWVRNELIWRKKSAMPESVGDRCTRNHEQIWVLTKGERYFWDATAVREGSAPSTAYRSGLNCDGGPSPKGKAGEACGVWAGAPNRVYSTSRNLRTVWTLKPEPCDWAYCRACDSCFIGSDRKRIRVVPGERVTSKDTTLRNDSERISHSVGSLPHGDVAPAANSKYAGDGLRICPVCGRHDGWVAHYAAYPSDLPRRAILAGTPEAGACAKCGKPWERMVEKGEADMEHKAACGADVKGEYHGVGKPAPPIGQAPGDVKSNILRGMRKTTTLGFRPSCSCEGAGEAVPSVVLDPFCGSGTSGIVAARLGRRFVGVDASADYVAVARERIRILGTREAKAIPACDAPLFAQPAQRSEP